MRENYLEALKWYGKAADMGNAEANIKSAKSFGKKEKDICRKAGSREMRMQVHL